MNLQPVSGQLGLDFGVPQDRRRVYILGAKRSMNEGITNPPLSMPKWKGSPPGLSTVLLKTEGKKKTTTVKKMSKTVVRNLKAARTAFKNAPSSKPMVVDLGAGPKFARSCQDFVPTLLAGRCSGGGYYWLQDRCC